MRAALGPALLPMHHSPSDAPPLGFDPQIEGWQYRLQNGFHPLHASLHVHDADAKHRAPPTQMEIKHFARD